jgi:hypothetical protein
MKAFLVFVNGKRFSLAGVGKNGVLTATVTLVKGQNLEGGGKLRSRLELRVGGLDTLTREHLCWHGQKRLKVGDEIKIRVVSAESVDKPTERYAPTQNCGRRKPTRSKSN